MHTSVPPRLFTLDTLLDHLQAHRREHPEHGNYNIEIRDHLLAAPPEHLSHDDQDQVVILLGVGR